MAKGHKQGQAVNQGHLKRKTVNNKGGIQRTRALEQAAAFERARDFEQAERIYLDLIREDARDPVANMQLATLYRQAGRIDLALSLLRNLDKLDHYDAPTCSRIGILWHQCGQLRKAVAGHERAVALKPGSIEFRFNLGLAMRDLGLPVRALECFQKNLKIKPDHLPSLLQLGLALRESGRLKEALDILQRAATLAPGNTEIQQCLALIHVDLSHIDDAIHCWERVLESDPGCSVAHLRLSHLRKEGHDIAGMEALHAKATNNADRINLAFGLGKAHEDAGNHDRAFSYLREGNQLKRKQFKFSLDDWQVFFEELQSIFNAEFLRSFPAGGIDDDTPIFVLGMPRSGSSLVEQILASHPDVFGAGELRALPALCAEGAQQRAQPFPGYLQHLQDGDWRELGEQYLAALREKNPAARHITDKMPQNFRFVGVISIILPRARIIHCQRNPLDNCWSIYKNLFAEGHPYAYDLTELGRFYRCYRSLMQHWNRVLSGRIHNLDYEALVRSPQSEIARLLEFCGLPFDQRCVDFHKNERAVDTMSAAQVRRPINADSIERWSLFREYLAPLSAELRLE